MNKRQNISGKAVYSYYNKNSRSIRATMDHFHIGSKRVKTIVRYYEGADVVFKSHRGGRKSRFDRALLEHVEDMIKATHIEYQDNGTKVTVKTYENLSKIAEVLGVNHKTLANNLIEYRKNPLKYR